MTAPKAPDLADVLAAQLRVLGVPEPMREVVFCKGRRWRFDLAWMLPRDGQPHRLIAVEAEGGQFSNGRHFRGKGFEADCLKYNTAASMGWAVYRFPVSLIETGEAAQTIAKLFEEAPS